MEIAVQAASLLEGKLDGIRLALLPRQIGDLNGWQEEMGLLSRAIFPPRVHVMIFDPSDSKLRDQLGLPAARYALDPDDVESFFAQLGGKRSAGPPGKEPSHEESAPALVRKLLLGAARSARTGRPEQAAALYREARRVCQAAAMPEAEAMVLIALGGACLAAGDSQQAIDSYEDAAKTGEAIEAWPVVGQALLGAGGALFAGKHYEPAAIVYRRAAGAAERGDIAPLRNEALRLEARCRALNL